MADTSEDEMRKKAAAHDVENNYIQRMRYKRKPQRSYESMSKKITSRKTSFIGGKKIGKVPGSYT